MTQETHSDLQNGRGCFDEEHLRVFRSEAAFLGFEKILVQFCHNWGGFFVAAKGEIRGGGDHGLVCAGQDASSLP